jgi:hypothetical protein
MERQQATNQKAGGPVIVLELNELCPPILSRMMARGDLPNFSRLHARSDVHVTWTDDQDLEPWVQWVTLHTGERQDVHGAKELDEGYRIDVPRIWDQLAERGVSSLIFGSMNGKTASKDVFLVPDPWSKRVLPTDPAYRVFHEFISFFVTEHTNAAAKPDRKTTMKFIRFMLGHGLTLSTIMAALRQVLSEKTTDLDIRWKRAIFLDLLMWDVFENEYKRRKPAFSTFFANSTAFLQHRYWRHMQPEVYEVKPSEKDMRSYGDAIEASYRHMDGLVGRAERLAGPNGRIVLATALSQEANLRYEKIGGKFVYRPASFDKLTAWAGGPKDVTYEPVMTHQSWASCKSDADADAFEAALGRLQINGEPVMGWNRTGTRVFFYCKLISRVADGAELVNTATGARVPFDQLFMLVGQVNNSQHNRDGALWLERGDAAGQVHDAKLPLEQGALLMLEMFGPRESRQVAPDFPQTLRPVAAQ